MLNRRRIRWSIIRRTSAAGFVMLACAMASRAVAASVTPDVNRDGIVNALDVTTTCQFIPAHKENNRETPNYRNRKHPEVAGNKRDYSARAASPSFDGGALFDSTVCP